MYNEDIWTSGLYALMSVGLVVLSFLVIYWIGRVYDSNKRVAVRANYRGRRMIRTGSMGDPVTDLLNNRPLGGIYLMGEGDVIPFLSAAPEDADDPVDYELAQMAVRFLMYALDRDDWKREFAEWESTLEESLLATKKAIETERLRAKLRVIPGGKEDDPPEDEDE